jgi:hypothetical protein
MVSLQKSSTNSEFSTFPAAWLLLQMLGDHGASRPKTGDLRQVQMAMGTTFGHVNIHCHWIQYYIMHTL